MKKTAYLLCAFLFAASTFMALPAKAQMDLPCNGDDPLSTSSCDTPNNSTNLPINNGIIYLLIAGVVVGIVAINRCKAAAYKV